MCKNTINFAVVCLYFLKTILQIWELLTSYEFFVFNCNELYMTVADINIYGEKKKETYLSSSSVIIRHEDNNFKQL